MFVSGAPLLAGVLAALGLHFFFGRDALAYPSKLAQDAGIAIILAVSLTLVNGFTGQFSMGHAGFMAIGGYTAAAITYYGSCLMWESPEARGGLLSWALDLERAPIAAWLTSGDLFFIGACLAGGLAAAAAGYLVGLPSLRLRGDYLAIVTLGFGEIVRVLIQTTRPQLTEPAEIAGASIPVLATSLGESLGMSGVPFYTSIFWIYLFVAITLVLTYRIKQSSFGRAFISIREDEIAAEAMGVHATRYKVRAFVISAFFAGIAGALFAHQIGAINAGELGFLKSFEIIIIVVLGGLGSISGAVVAAVVLTIVPEWLREFAQYRMIVYAFLLILIMVLRPQGLFGVREIWDLWGKGRRARAEAPA